MRDTSADYRQYRGKCKELADAACAADPTLILVRGHYFCPLWNSNEQHWWCVKQDGTIYDPSAAQFPSNGNGIYTPFDGFVECSECGKVVLEENASFHGRYAFCSTECNMRFVGL